MHNNKKYFAVTKYCRCNKNNITVSVSMSNSVPRTFLDLYKRKIMAII